MNMLDIIIAVVVLLGLLRGFQTGLIRSLMSLIGWLVALVIASRFAGQFAVWFAGLIDSPVLQTALAFLSLVIVVLAVLYVLVAVLSRLIDKLNITVLDRMAGGVLGAAKGILVVLIIMSFTAPALQRFEFWQRSVMVKELMPLAPVAVQLTKQVVATSWQQMNSTTQ